MIIFFSFFIIIQSFPSLRCGLVQSHDIQKTPFGFTRLRFVRLSESPPFSSKSNVPSTDSCYSFFLFLPLLPRGNGNEVLGRHCTPPILSLITVSNDKMYILPLRDARFENAKIFVVFKIRFGYKNRARVRSFFFATLSFPFLSFFRFFPFFFD